MGKREYYPQLDTLRAIAAFAVINLHWFNSHYLSLFKIQFVSNWGFGRYGVQLFFVLSGFLIADILLKKKTTQTKWGITKNFYIRRALRLFPIYYLFLAFLLIIDDTFVMQNIVWYATYTVNLKFFSSGLVDVWSNHLWTLSVEEQFYLLFPFLILSIPGKYEEWVSITFIVMALAVKAIFFYSDKPFELLTIAQTDMLGIGIWLAIIYNRRQNIFLLLTGKWGKISLILGLGLCVWIYYFASENLILRYSFDLLLMISFGLLIANTVKGFTGLVGIIFENGLLKYLGKVSYGLYLYHKIVPLMLAIVLNETGLSIENIVGYYLINLFILLLVTHLSWVLLESKLMKLKSRFNYDPVN